jgi:hypothetical protein
VTVEVIAARAGPRVARSEEPTMPGVNQIDGFEATTFEHGGRSHPVFRAGSGPAVVVVVHECQASTPESWISPDD